MMKSRMIVGMWVLLMAVLALLPVSAGAGPVWGDAALRQPTVAIDPPTCLWYRDRDSRDRLAED
jgi:hypothetical protein